MAGHDGATVSGTVRRAGLFAVAVAVLMVLISGAPTRAHAAVACGPEADQAVKSLSTNEARDAMRCLVNNVRKNRGRHHLKSNGKLESAAMKHTRTMKRKHCFSHQCNGEKSLQKRLEKYLRGAHSFGFAEDISHNDKQSITPREFVKQLMKSHLHRQNILRKSMRDFGVGFAVDGKRFLYTIDFGVRHG